MPIIYTLIARQQNVLCEYTEGTGNFMTYARAVLRDVDERNHPTNSRNVFTVDGHNFFYYTFDGLIYVCMCDELFQSDVAYAMLIETKNEFLSKYGQKGKTAIAYSMKSFDMSLKNLMLKYDNIKIDTKMTQVRDQVKRVKNQMLENLNQLMERGDKIGMIVSKTEKLQQDALVFEKTASNLKRLFWWKSLKATFVLVFVVAILIWLISAWICGFDFSKCKSDNINRQYNDQIKNIDLPFTSAP
ncbi:vesicle-associated membrane protein [Thraustotheca clavata]|uniref:Vesicle-associated membrane protein n=1 Tax=Thraustotheca clavata TaxID=74557 RepID=A0A1W0A9X9_9STRA|nr:vesicle-associated membrane protein [Thraustotheca clavata]